MKSIWCCFVGCENFKLGVKDDCCGLYQLQYPMHFSVMYCIGYTESKKFRLVLTSNDKLDKLCSSPCTLRIIFK